MNSFTGTSSTSAPTTTTRSLCTVVIPNTASWICSNANASTNGGGRTFYLEKGARLSAYGSGSTTVYLKSGASFSSGGGGSNIVFYETGASWDYNGGGSNTETLCSPLTFIYTNVPVNGCSQGSG